MTHYLGYIHRYYLRSYLYTAPVLFLFATLMIVYSDSSNHVLQSYSFGGMWVFLASLWLAYGFTNLEHPTQQQITVLHMGSLQKYLVGKVIYAILLGLFAAACSLLYPILLQRFAVSLTVGKMSIAFIENISMALLGTAIGLYFTQSLIAKKRTAVLVALLTAALAVSSEQMVRSLPLPVHVIPWLLPPVSPIVAVASQWSAFPVWQHILALAWGFIYTAVLLLVFIRTVGTRTFK
ncbi:hypothetical protein [Alicyclobacillus sp. SO9]|uniref:hypothetical protein n=1 Tax=Alicyclobacillus sp. SO9 TaxID=2665646 RepID=UPI0018E830E4|nr:hypothetical protein [Alicyclobacillus sp. SO9]QQE78864.1 hypothetical protein GI364_24015 [Alicyclobacillus sp. SO9]